MAKEIVLNTFMMEVKMIKNFNKKIYLNNFIKMIKIPSHNSI